MLLDNAPSQYDQNDQDKIRRTLLMEDNRNVKTGTVFNKILMKDTVTGHTVTLTVASGSLVIT